MSLDTGRDEGYLIETIFRENKTQINFVTKDYLKNIVTSAGNEICLINRRSLEKKYIATAAPTIAFTETARGLYKFTGRTDLQVSVWSQNWTKLCVLSTPVMPDTLLLSSEETFLYAKPFAKEGKVKVWRVTNHGLDRP